MEPDNNDAQMALWGLVVSLLIVASWAFHAVATPPGLWGY